MKPAPELRTMARVKLLHAAAVWCWRRTGWWPFMAGAFLAFSWHDRVFWSGMARLRREEWAARLRRPA